MTKTVKPKVAKYARKPRTRRVRVKKTAKIDARIETELRDRFYAACDKRDHVRARVLRRLIVAFCEAVEEGRSTDGELEVRAKGSPK